jgi:hypothetical protein
MDSALTGGGGSTNPRADALLAGVQDNMGEEAQVALQLLAAAAATTYHQGVPDFGRTLLGHARGRFVDYGVGPEASRAMDESLAGCLASLDAQYAEKGGDED